MSATLSGTRTEARGGWSVVVHSRIESIEPSAWDGLCGGGNILASHRFVRLCQDSGIENAIYRHLLIERRGRLAAVATLCSIRVALDVLSSGGVRTAIRLVRGWRHSFLELPIVMCGLPVSFGSSCVRMREGEDPATIAALVASEAESFADELGAELVVFKEFDSNEMQAFVSLRSHGYFRAPSLPYCTLTLNPSSFDDYVASLRSGYRRQVRSSLTSGLAAGLSIRSVQDFTPDCGTLFGLYGQIMERAEHRLERLNVEFFRNLPSYLGSSARALFAEREGRAVAAAILLEAFPSTIFLLAGIDYEQNRACGAYPYLVTQVVADAHRRGARVLDLGQTSYRLKGRLGAQAKPRWLYLKHTRPLRHAALRAVSGALFPNVEVAARRVFRSPGHERNGGDTSARPVVDSDPRH